MMITDLKRFFCTIAVAATLLGYASFSMGAEAQPVVSPTLTEAPGSIPSPPHPTNPAATTVDNASSVLPAKQVARIGFVDLMKIAEESSIGKASKVRFSERSNKVQAQLSAKQKQLEKQKSALEAKLPTLIPDQRGAKIKEYEKKVDDFRTAVKNAEKEMQPLQEELTQAITNQTLAACEAYGKENGFSLISVRKDLLYVGTGYETLDITTEIIKKMNELKK
jgi:outer membrane protein